MKNILVVDDSDIDRLLMSGLLGKLSSYSVIVAEDGVQALQKLDEWPIDLVLTDLQMPKMDGLELVKRIRAKKLEIPVILTTGVGSEEIASKALLAGAAGYIPKNKLNEMLASTISEVLKIFDGEQSYDRLLKRTKLSRYEVELENDPTLIPLYVNFCERILSSSSPTDRIDCLRIAIAIDQALRNALYRGNLEIDSDYSVQSLVDANSLEEMPSFVRDRFTQEPYKSRKINSVIEIKPSGFVIRISDEGPGFDTSHVGDLSQLATRGTNLMIAFMDSVDYNKTGNEVLMKYRFDRSKASFAKRSQGTAGSHGPRLVCQSTGKIHEIAAQKFVIGSGKASHLKLDGDAISRLHCVLKVDNGTVSIVNISPQNKTLINGKEVEKGQLKPGDTIKLGDHAFKFESA